MDGPSYFFVGRFRKAMQSVNILTTGSDCWNPGDTLVKSGAMALLNAHFAPRHINWHFFDFSGPRQPSGAMREDLNKVFIQDWDKLAPRLDYIVVPGLMVGRELHDFYQRVKFHNVGHKLVAIGGMNESQYCAEWAARSPMKEMLKQAKLIIGRTEEYPESMRRDGINYKCLPCPSIFGDEEPSGYYENRMETMGRRPAQVCFSIQLPHLHPLAVVNHSIDPESSSAAIEAAHIVKRSGDNILLTAHHKSEFYHFHGSDNLYFSSHGQGLYLAYWAADFVVSTRLHACLWAHALGKPSLCLGASLRHVKALAKFPLVDVAREPCQVIEWVNKFKDPKNYASRHFQILEFNAKIFGQYSEALRILE